MISKSTILKSVGIVVGLFLLLWAVYSFVGHEAQRDILAAREAAALARGKTEVAEQALKVAEVKSTESEKEVARVHTDNEKLRAALAKATVPPVTVVDQNATESAVVAGLQDLGLLRVGLALPDGRTVWQWGTDVKRIPALETRLGAAEDLVGGLTTEVTALGQQIVTEKAVTDSAKTVIGHKDEQILALNQEVKAWDKKAKSDKIMTNLKIGGTAVFVGGIVYLLKR